MSTHLRFTVAKNPGHYTAVHALMRSEGFEKSKLGFPTLMAYEGEELIGIVGTRVHKGMIVGGPLVVRTDRRRLFTILRLCEAYDNAMKSLGISTFILSVDKGSILDRGMARYFPQQAPYAEDEGNRYFLWKVGQYGQQGISAGSLRGREGPTEEPSGAVGPSTHDNRATTATE